MKKIGHCMAAAVACCLLTGSWLAAQEREPAKKLVIHFKNGKTVSYSLSEVESIQFEEGRVGEGSMESAMPSVGVRSGRDLSAATADNQPIGPVRLLRGAGSLNRATDPANLFSGMPSAGWASRPDARFPHEFIIELPQTVAVGAVEFDNGSSEGGYPGSSARNVSVQASNVGPSGPYTSLAAVVLARGVNAQHFAVGPTTIRWLRILIQSNYGHPNYTQLMGIRFYPPPAQRR
jgi:hypothetical protein